MLCATVASVGVDGATKERDRHILVAFSSRVPGIDYQGVSRCCVFKTTCGRAGACFGSMRCVRRCVVKEPVVRQRREKRPQTWRTGGLSHSPGRQRPTV